MSTDIPKKVTLNTLASGVGPSREERVAWYQHMQETQPVRFHPEYDLWEVFRYKDVQHVLSDARTFSLGKRYPEDFPATVLGQYDDPVEHGRIRNLVAKPFTPRGIEELKPHLIQIIDELLAPAIATGKMEIVAGLTNLLPTRVMTEIMGLPLCDQARFRQWAAQLFAQYLGLFNPDNTEVLQYFSALVDGRKRNPSGGLICDLLAAQENGANLTREDVIHFSLELMWASDSSTSWMLTSVFAHLCQQPEIYQALRDNPALIPGTIEEVLRYDFYTFGTWRTARHDTTLGEHQIKAGQTVAVWIGAANFDEEYFPYATQFDITRYPNPHMMFSRGMKYCLGAPLARLQGQTLLERLITHFLEILFDPAKPIQYMGHTNASFTSIKSLDVLTSAV